MKTDYRDHLNMEIRWTGVRFTSYSRTGSAICAVLAIIWMLRWPALLPFATEFLP